MKAATGSGAKRDASLMAGPVTEAAFGSADDIQKQRKKARKLAKVEQHAKAQMPAEPAHLRESSKEAAANERAARAAGSSDAKVHVKAKAGKASRKGAEEAPAGADAHDGAPSTGAAVQGTKQKKKKQKSANAASK